MTLVFYCIPIGIVADKGTATYYTAPYVPRPSEEIWDNGGACGRKYTVKCVGATNQGDQHPCNGNSVEVTIVDFCPPGSCRATIDLSEEAFSSIAHTNAGKIDVDYN
ncbi:hypothetical protein LguiB_021730 [Lonicera macranthoides]